jgi:hypothetical protein
MSEQMKKEDVVDGGERKCETIFFINTFSLRTFVINLLSFAAFCR